MEFELCVLIVSWEKEKGKKENIGKKKIVV